MPSLLPFTNYRLRHLDHGSLLLWLSKGESISYVPYLTYPIGLQSFALELAICSDSSVINCACSVDITSRIGRAYAPDFEAKTSFNQHIRALANFYLNTAMKPYYLPHSRKTFTAR